MLQRCTAGRSRDKKKNRDSIEVRKLSQQCLYQQFRLEDKRTVGRRERGGGRCRRFWGGGRGAVGKSDLPVSVWHALGPCDRSGRGGVSPAGSTERRACRRAACRTPAGDTERERDKGPWNASRAGVDKFFDWWPQWVLRFDWGGLEQQQMEARGKRLLMKLKLESHTIFCLQFSVEAKSCLGLFYMLAPLCV